MDLESIEVAPSNQRPADEAVKREAAEIGRRAYHAARASGESADEAKLAAERAMFEHLKGRAPSPLTASAPVDHARAMTSIDATGRARVEAQHAALAPELRGVVSEALYVPGTIPLASSVQVATDARAAWEALPTMREVADRLIATVRAEERQRHLVTLASLAPTTDDRLMTPRGPATYTRRGLSTLIARVGCGGAGYIADCPPELRAENLRVQLRSVTSDERHQVLTARGRGGHLTVRAVNSDSYTPHDADTIARAMLAVPSLASTRGGVTYDGDRYRIDVRSHTTVAPAHQVVGEVFEAGVRVTSDDTGGGSIRIAPLVYMRRCVNFSIAGRERDIARIKHVGDIRQLARRVEDAIRRAAAAVGPFLHAWNRACEIDLQRDADSSAEVSLRGYVRGLAARKRLPTLGRTVPELEDLIVGAWSRDGGSAVAVHELTPAALANAITRMAHEIALEDPYASDELEALGGELVYETQIPWLSADEASSRAGRRAN